MNKNQMTCRLCGSNNLNYFYSQGNHNEFKYYKCSHCELVNIDLLTLNITKNQSKYETSFPEPYNRKMNPGSYDTFDFINKNITKKSKLLDIGCGNGALLLLAKKNNWNVKGYELSQSLADNIRNELNIDVIVGNFLEIKNFDEKYNLVTLRHVLEHLPNPLIAMKNISLLLNKGDYAILEFPNIDALSFKYKRILQNTGLHKKKYAENYLPGHCNEYNKHSFKYLAEKSGFSLVIWETYSSKQYMNAFYKYFAIGTKARAMIKKL